MFNKRSLSFVGVNLFRWQQSSASTIKRFRLIDFANLVPVESMGWLQGEVNYTRLYYQDGTFSIITQPLHWFEYHFDFIRVHGSAIVNPSYVQEFVQKRGRWDGCGCLLTGFFSLPELAFN